MSPQPEPVDEIYRGVTRTFSVIILLFGLAIIVITLVNGGTVTSGGIWLGLIFTVLGAGRLYLALRRDDGDDE